MEGRFYGQVFQDSDVSKWLEAVGNVLMLERDKELEEKADSVIDIIARAQQPDGYLDTYFIIEEPDKRWTNVLECHELYCAGHFIEGAVAYYLATGKEKVYNVAKNWPTTLTACSDRRKDGGGWDIPVRRWAWHCAYRGGAGDTACV